MPKIKLRPNSAEFENAAPQEKINHCDMPGCSENAEHKAPKDRSLGEYYRFCLEHAREYNLAWDFFSGMSGSEVEEHMTNSLYGDRPTWRYDNDAAAEDILKRQAWETYHFAKAEDGPGTNNQYVGNNRNTPEFEALAIMGLQPPVTLEVIKEKYKELAKRHHPDLNQGCSKSEELLKRINMAYTILKLAYEQFEQLPERDQ